MQTKFSPIHIKLLILMGSCLGEKYRAMEVLYHGQICLMTSESCDEKAPFQYIIDQQLNARDSCRQKLDPSYYMTPMQSEAFYIIANRQYEEDLKKRGVVPCSLRSAEELRNRKDMQERNELAERSLMNKTIAEIARNFFTPSQLAALNDGMAPEDALKILSTNEQIDSSGQIRDSD